MAQKVDRTELEGMKRGDLQKLCKDFGLKANLKTEALIDLILDAQKHKPQGRQSSRRSVSTRTSSRSTGAGRTSSMIVHDLDEEEEDEHDEPNEVEEEEVQDQPQVSEPVIQPPPRTRKAKETQTRLGVGRPLAAGGQGARAVTKSVSVSKSKKGKTSKSMKPVEATILEEEPETAPEPQFETAKLAGASTVDTEINQQPQELPSLDSFAPTNPSSSLTEIDRYVSEALKPLYQHINALKSEVSQMQSMKDELAQLRAQLADTENWKERIEALTNEVKDLRQMAALAETLHTELQQLKETVSARRSSTPTSEDAAAAGYRTPTMTRPSIPSALSIPRAPALVTESASSANQLPHPGIAPILLGKRHRDSTASTVAGVVDAGQAEDMSEADLAKTVIRPTKKRPKLNDAPNEDGDNPEVVEENDEPPRGPKFTVFSDSEQDSYIDPPPPTTPLPAFYSSSTPPNNGAGPSRHPATSTQNAAENMPPFSFSFLPVPPTPGAGNPYSMPSFPYPEPPQSPTPVRDSYPGGIIGSSSRDRNDVFQTFGLPPPGRPRSRLSPALRSQEAGSGGSASINPAALESHDSADDGGATMRSTDDSSSVKRTMYGTELESDTRFSDFGLDGVAAAFNWTGTF